MWVLYYYLLLLMMLLPYTIVLLYLHHICNQNPVSLPPCFTTTTFQVIQLDADGILAVQPAIVCMHAIGWEFILVVVAGLTVTLLFGRAAGPTYPLQPTLVQITRELEQNHLPLLITMTHLPFFSTNGNG